MTAPPPREGELQAIRAALSLLSAPPRGRHVRQSPLPDGVDTLIKVAVDFETAEALSQGLQRTPGHLMDAASFFIEQILLAPGVDSYRALGATRESPTPHLRQNFVHLCKWAHSEEREGFAGPAYLVRITQAWNNVKTPARRAAYDQSLDARLAEEAYHRERDVKRGRSAEAEKTIFREGSLAQSRRHTPARSHKRPGLIGRLLAFAFNVKF
ncbi:hypothetical protein WOC76_18305 [Methylocystis sp. IM3]|uniref:hypothetical protein n=1 Tax=unclassified Methylocystis TaxID=2625913 RepID=UPI0030FAD093